MQISRVEETNMYMITDDHTYIYFTSVEVDGICTKLIYGDSMTAMLVFTTADKFMKLWNAM